jgi:hypothetical protein
MTTYGKALQKFQSSPEFKQWADPSTLGSDPKVRRVLIENRLIEAFESAWKARDADNGEAPR